MLWTIIAIVMVLYSDDIPKVTFVHPYMMDDMLDYDFNLDQADKQFDDVPGIQENLIDAYHASEGYIHLYQNVYFLGPWLFFVILCYLCYDMYIECVNLLFYLA